MPIRVVSQARPIAAEVAQRTEVSSRPAPGPAQRVVDAVRAVEDGRRAGGAGGGEPGGEDPRLRGEARVQLLGRRRRCPGRRAALRPGCRRCPARGWCVAASRPSSRAVDQRRGEDAGHHRGVQARGVEPVRRGGGDPADGLVADHRRLEDLATGGADLLTDGEGRGQHDGRGVHQPAGVGVVEVERVHEGAVGQRRGGALTRVVVPEDRGLGAAAEPGGDGDGGRGGAGTRSPRPRRRGRRAGGARAARRTASGTVRSPTAHSASRSRSSSGVVLRYRRRPPRR